MKNIIARLLTAANRSNELEMPFDPAAQEVTETNVIARERQTWEAIKAKSSKGLGSLMTDDYLYVSDDGIFDKQTTTKGVSQNNMKEATLSDFKMVIINEDAAVVTYLVLWQGTRDGKPLVTKVRASSALVKRGGRLLTAYHQDTAAREPTEARRDESGPVSADVEAPTATPTPPADATPAASATDRERQLWDALKRKDYDAYADLLADDVLEVEPDKVYSKAESVESMKRLDASRLTLDKFMEVPLGAKATMVTYVVTVPVGEGQLEERHSTIWANRGGRWQAVFHFGTQVDPG